MLKIICFLTIIVLMLAANVSAVVYDDEGKVITEEEIMTEINQVGKNGCCFLGTTFGAYLTGLSFLILYLNLINPDWLFDEGNDEEAFLCFASGAIIGGYLGYKCGNKLGKLIDRKVVIAKIKEKRRTQKQNEDKESFVPDPE